MSSLLSALKMHMGSMDQSTGTHYFGIVTSYNPATHSVKVQVQPEGDTPVQSGWLPICTPSLGNGWGIVMPPNIGEQVLVAPDSGDMRHGVMMGSVFSDASQPPTPGGGSNVQNGELAIVHQSGAYLQLHNDGTATLNSPSTITISATTSILLTTPDVVTSGNLMVGTGATGSFSTATGETVTVMDGIITNIE